MSTPLTLILGIHYHISNGAGYSLFERVYKDKIRPVLSSLYKFPKIPAVLHFSGSLWYWIERNHSELFMLITDMIHRKQIELLGGGFYEPMIPLINYKDKVGHIEMLTTYLRKHFGKRTQGCLLPALAWESSMPSILSSCNIAYTFLDESYFFAAGVNKEYIYKPYITEDKGKLVKVFPVSRHFDHDMGKNARRAFERMLSLTPGQNRIISVFPPCFNNGDADQITETSAFDFLSELSDYEDRIDFSLPSRFIKNLTYLQKIYFPQKAAKQFLIEYPETNHLYAKMVFVRALIDQIRGDKIRKRRAYEELWKAQGCDLYREERQGAVNQAIIRNAAYQALLEAENITRDHNGFIQSLMAFDFDFDGVNEYVFQSAEVNCFICATGANIFELDYLSRPWNYGSVSSINGRRYSFRDMIAPPDFSPLDIVNKNYSRVRLCGDEHYEVTAMDRQRCRVSFKLPAGAGAHFSEIEIEKTFNLNKNELYVTYGITNRDSGTADFTFMPELNLAFSRDSENGLRIFSYGEYNSFSDHSEKQSVKAVDGEDALFVSDASAIDFQDIDNEVIINLSASFPFDAWIFSESGAAGLIPPASARYQSSRVMVRKLVSLEAGASYTIKFTLGFHH
ncbi:MAG: DUF1926 domain-containing protein [Spirochaetaceae bacterium]|jgi:hypothetical protein|nr:DUF1926 domain-containing protein [Spirochaetaceae bacterium]